MADKLVPTEADREAAAEIYRRVGQCGFVQHIIDGIEDDAGVVQLVAQHAAAARAEERERCAKIAEKEIGSENQVRGATATYIAAAIRAGAGE